MASPNLEDLFEDSRIIEWDWTLLLLVFYTPIGIVLLLIRIFALIQFYLMFLYLPYSPLRRYMLRLCSSVLGVFISEKQVSKAPVPDNAVWVANHCSPFDSILLQVIARKKRPILFPEGETTSAKTGLLKFQTRVFEQIKRNNSNVPLQPISVRVSRPFPPLAVTVLDTPIWTDLFFLLFSPCTVFTVRLLEPVDCREDEELEAYVDRVQSVISQDLGVAVTVFTAKDKDELVKRRRVELQRPPTIPRPNDRLQVMANQVKEVLPHVPMATILRDLGRTNSVDITVANLVEGVVPFTPEPVPSTSSASSSSQSTAPLARSSSGASTSQMQVASSTFGKSVHERGLSLQERKRRLLREAQLRYCEKHGLQVPGINC